MDAGCCWLSEHGSVVLVHINSLQIKVCHVMSDALPTPCISYAASHYCRHLDADWVRQDASELCILTQ